MTRRDIGRALAINRVAFGAGLLSMPGLYGRTWIGRGARRHDTQVFARALGARDLALGLGALATLDQPAVARRWFQAQAIADGADVLATLLAGRSLPWASRLFALTVAGGSAAVAVACAASLEEPPD